MILPQAPQDLAQFDFMYCQFSVHSEGLRAAHSPQLQDSMRCRNVECVIVCVCDSVCVCVCVL